MNTRVPSFSRGVRLWWLEPRLPLACIVLLLGGALIAQAAPALPAPTLVAHEFMLAPDAGWGGVFSGGSDPSIPVFQDLDINDRGEVLFSAMMADWSPDPEVYRAIYRYSLASKKLERVIADNQRITPGGLLLEEVYWPRYSCVGEVLFRATYRNAEDKLHTVQLLERQGTILPLYSTESVIHFEGAFEGTLALFHGCDMNGWGKVVVYGSVAYRNSSNDSYGKRGLYLWNPAGGGSWSRIITERDPVPGGGFLGSNYLERVFVSEQGDICLPAVTADTPGGPAYDYNVLFLPAGGAWQSLLTNGDTVTYQLGGIPAEFTVRSIVKVDMNLHGQVVMVVMDQANHSHLCAYANGQIRRVAGHGDPSPTPNDRWTPGFSFPGKLNSANIPTFGLSNGLFLLPENGSYLPEVAFQFPVTPGAFPTTYDWVHLQYSFRNSLAYTRGVELDFHHEELTVDAIEAMKQLGPAQQALYAAAAPLKIQLLPGNQLLLRWPVEWAVSRLESATTLGAGAVWTPETTTPERVGIEYQVTRPLAGPTRFFRLVEE